MSDFEIEISGAPDAYRITARSDAGEVEATSVAFPLDEQELRYQLQAIELALLRSASETRRLTSELERPVQEFGRQLFDFVLPPQLQANWIAARQRATEREESLRIRLRIGPPKLMALPWEVLFDPYRDDYLSLSTPMVRYLDVFEPRRPLTVTPPLRVLVMTAQPAGLIPLDVEHEKQRLVTALAPLETHGRVRLSWVEGQTWADLDSALDQDRWHVFHFVGHGGFDRRSSEGRIALADKDGEVDEVPATDLGLLLAKHTSLRLAVLNSCDGARGSTGDRFSSTASVLVRRGIPAVVAMQYEISDQAAVAFAQRFYSALAAQQPVDQAVTDARLAIKRARQNSLEWVTPVIYLRSADGALFDLTDVPVTPPQPSSPVESSDLSAPQREPEPLRPSPLLATPEQESSPKKAALHEVPDDHIYSKPLIPTELTRLAHDSGVYRVADSPDGSPSSPASARQQPESSPTSNSDLDLSEKSSTGQVLKPATFDQQLEPTTKTSDDDVIKLTLYRKSSLSKRSVARRLLILLTVGAVAVTMWIGGQPSQPSPATESKGADVGAKPEAIVISRDGKRAYVASEGDRAISVVSTATNTLISVISVRGQPSSVAVSPAGDRIYAAELETNMVTVIDSKRNSIIAEVPVGQSPQSIAVSKDGRTIYTADQSSGGVSVVDASTLKKTRSFAVGGGCSCFPTHLAISPSSGQVFVTDYSKDGGVYVLDAVSGLTVRRFAVGDNPGKIAFSQDGETIYLASVSGSPLLSVVNAITGQTVKSISAGGVVNGIALSTDGSRLFMAASGIESIIIADTATSEITRTILYSGALLVDIVALPDGRAYAIDQNSRYLIVVT